MATSDEAIMMLTADPLLYGSDALERSDEFADTAPPFYNNIPLPLLQVCPEVVYPARAHAEKLKQKATADAPVLNQQRKGACWVYAATTMFNRLSKQRSVKFQIQPVFVFMWARVEALSCIAKLVENLRDVDQLRFLMEDAAGDGGSFTQLQDVVRKYGVGQTVAESAMTSYTCATTAAANDASKAVLALVHQGKVTSVSAHDLFKKIWTQAMWASPEPADDTAARSRQAYVDLKGMHPEFDFDNYTPLVHDPRHRPYEIGRCGYPALVLGSDAVATYVNVPDDVLKTVILESVKNNLAMWTAVDYNFLGGNLGDVNAYDAVDPLRPFELGWSLKDLNESQRLDSRMLAVNHAMCVIAASPHGVTVQNSHGVKANKCGMQFIDYTKCRVVVASNAILERVAPEALRASRYYEYSKYDAYGQAARAL